MASDSITLLRKDREAPKKLSGGLKKSLMISIDASLEARFKEVVGTGNVSRYVGVLMEEGLARWHAEGIIDDKEWAKLQALGTEAGKKKPKAAPAAKKSAG